MSEAKSAGGDVVESGILIELNGLDLPDDFSEADLAELRETAVGGGAAADVIVTPEAQERDPFILGALFVIHFLSKHAVETALAVAEGGVWDGMKATFRKLRRQKGSGDIDRVTVQYPNGTTVVVEATDAEQLASTVRELISGR
jgi:hypothetical protein